MNTRAYLAELLGTFLFFAIGLASVQAVEALGAAAPLLVVVPLAFGLGLLAAVFAFGHISGGHFIPSCGSTSLPRSSGRSSGRLCFARSTPSTRSQNASDNGLAFEWITVDLTPRP